MFSLDGDEIRNMFIREIIAARLDEIGWSQADLARAANIPRQNISPMLRGERPIRVQHLIVIDHALGLGIDYGGCEIGEDK